MFALKSKITIKVLNYFFINTHAKKHINDLAGLLELDSGNLTRKLKELEKEGILLSDTVGNQRHYFLNKKYPLLKEFKKIFDSKYGIKNQIADLLMNIKGLKEAYFFGSFAKNSIQQESDIDMLIIGEHSSRDVKSKIMNFQKTYQREFNIIDITKDEFKEKKENKDPFITNIFSNKTIKII